MIRPKCLSNKERREKWLFQNRSSPPRIRSKGVQALIEGALATPCIFPNGESPKTEEVAEIGEVVQKEGLPFINTLVLGDLPCPLIREKKEA